MPYILVLYPSVFKRQAGLGLDEGDYVEWMGGDELARNFERRLEDEESQYISA